MKTVVILTIGFTVGLVIIANAVFALISPAAWMHFRWHGLTTLRRGFKEEDLNSISGRAKIIFLNVVFLVAGLSVVILLGAVVIAGGRLT
jgi:hypothetical protein